MASSFIAAVCVVAVLFAVGTVEGAYRFAGKCPSLDAVPNLNTYLFKGEWFENRHYNPIFGNVDRCLKYNLAQPFGPYIPLQLSGRSSQNFQTSSISGTATVLGPTGVLSLKFPSVGSTATYNVIGTDYFSYAVIWNCENSDYWNSQNAIILTRSKDPSPATIETALRVADSKFLSRYLFVPADQSFC